MKKQIGGYLNLNESFEQVFNGLSNLNESKRKKELDFFTPAVKALVNFSKFRELCNDAAFEKESFDQYHEEMGIGVLEYHELSLSFDEENPKYKGIVNEAVWDFIMQS